MKSWGWMALLSLLVTGCQTAPPVAPRLARPICSIPWASRTPKVTAAADDAAWKTAAIIPALVTTLHAPADDRPLPTEVRLLWDKDWLYIRFISLGPEPYSPHGAKRDALHYQGDAVEVFLDPVGDGRQYFEFQLSAAGGLLDQNTLLTTEPKSDPDRRLLLDIIRRDYWPNIGYDMPAVRTSSSVEKHGNEFRWIADLALPAAGVLKRLGKTQYEPMQLRANFVRYHWTGPLDDPQRKLVPINWSSTVRGCPHQSPAAMGTIELIDSPIALQ